MIPPTEEVEIDPIALPMLNRDSGCPECLKGGMKSKLKTFFAFTEQIEGAIAEVHVYFCQEEHTWSRRTRPERKQKGLDISTTAI